MGRGSGVAVSCAVGHRHNLDPALLWLWRRLAAVALILALAWEPPYAAGAALKSEKKERKRKKKSLFLEAARTCLFGKLVAICCGIDFMAHPVFLPAACFLVAF